MSRTASRQTDRAGDGLPFMPARRRYIFIGISGTSAYLFCYMGKNMLSAAMPQLTEEGICGAADLGSMGSTLLFCYGIGQLICGVIGNTVPCRYMVPIGLALSGGVMCLFPTFHGGWAGIALWGACGFFSSSLWGPLTRFVGENTDRRTGQLLLTLLNAAAVIGPMFTYILALWGSRSGVWYVPFYVLGCVLILGGIAYFFLSSMLERRSPPPTRAQNRLARSDNGQPGSDTPNGSGSHDGCSSDKRRVHGIRAMSKGGIRGLISPEFVLMVCVTVLYGVLRNAVSLWMPTYIAGNFNIGSSAASLIMVMQPVTGLSGSALTVVLMRRRLDERRMCAVLFAASAALLSVVFLCGSSHTAVAVAALFAVGAAMACMCNIIFSVYVLRFIDTGNLSGISGFLDFVSYAAAAAANVLFSALSGRYGWSAVTAAWLISALGGTALAACAAARRK